MKIAVGKDAYACDSESVVGRGIMYNSADLETALAERLPPIINDEPGKNVLASVLAGLATTSFAEQGIKRILSAKRQPEDWRVGEAIAEAYLVDHRNCYFPWPSGRDLKNPDGSPPGADLVGFEEQTKTRFAFGEVKTSQQELWPPSAMTGRHGLSKQIEGLRDSLDTKEDLIRYLGFRAQNSSWETKYKKAAQTYVNDPTDVALHGIMVRDVKPDEKDLRSRCIALGNKKPTHTSIEMRAIYLPAGAIKGLPARITSKNKEVN